MAEAAGGRRRQIVAMGGGSFGLDGRFTPLDRYVLGLVSRPRPRVCFVPTASAESPPYVMRFYEAYASERCEPSHLLLFGRPRTDIREFLLAQDVIYVGGGNTANMLAVWRVHGVDRVLAEAWQRGIVLTGVSAGMICWFEAGVTDSFGPLARLDLASVPIRSTTSARVIPMPLSRMVRVRASLSTTISMARSEVSTSRSLLRKASSRTLSSASDAFEISSRRKESLLEYTEWTIRSSSWRVSA